MSPETKRALERLPGKATQAEILGPVFDRSPELLQLYSRSPQLLEMLDRIVTRATSLEVCGESYPPFMRERLKSDLTEAYVLLCETTRAMLQK